MTETKKVAPKKPAKKASKPNLYELLSAPIPEEYLVEYTEDGKSFSGYHAQYAIDLLNSAVGLGNWFTEERLLKEELIGGSWFVSMALEISILYDEKEITVTGYGAGYAKKGVNSYKSAKTSAFKNACRYLGIGKELYVQGFEDDIPTNKAGLPQEDAPVSVETTEPGTVGGSEEIIKLIAEAQSKEAIEALRIKVSEFECGDAVKKIILKKFNEKLISFG